MIASANPLRGLLSKYDAGRALVFRLGLESESFINPVPLDL